jgi:alpha-L-fucosidase 2
MPRSRPTGPGAWDPTAEENLRLTAPIRTWDEAVPLGNGRLGGLLWGEGGLLRFSLDRGDLWDERPAPGDPLGRLTYAQIVRWVAEGRNADITRVADAESYDRKHPTKIPAGRLEIRLGGGRTVTGFELNLATAEGWAGLSDGSKVEAFLPADAPVALLRIPGTTGMEARLLAPESVAQLGYPAAKAGVDGGFRWFVQQTAAGAAHCVAVATRESGGSTLVAVTVTATADGGDVVEQARQRTAAALEAGYDGMRVAHLAWWREYWGRSRVRLPDADVQRHYSLVRYFQGSASRRGSPPMPLQGVWTADAGTLPPWKGDYHHDLNTQMTYMAYQGAGDFEEGLCFLDYLWDRLPVFRKFARDFFGTPGANVPGVRTLAGAPLGGWAQYSLAPTPAAWLGHLFYLHWRYTGDGVFLRDRAYPWCAEVGTSLAALLRRDDAGRLVLPTSSSPEIHDNSARAWLRPNSNYDIALLRMLFLGLTEMAQALGRTEDTARWRDLAAGLGDFHTGDDGTLKINADESLTASHRHFSNLMNLYPFNLTTIEGSERDREIIRASLRQYDALGTQAWCGYSFSWMAALRARVGDAESAARHLDLFVKAFILRNGFHANGDQTRSGLSSFTYRPFTLEGNFLAVAAVHEMLLQSWSARPGTPSAGIVRLFPATPWRWHDVAFDDLRAEGGHRVSARRENNATTWFRVVAGSTGPVRIRNNFGGRTPSWDRRDVRADGQARRRGGSASVGRA